MASVRPGRGLSRRGSSAASLASSSVSFRNVVQERSRRELMGGSKRALMSGSSRRGGFQDIQELSWEQVPIEDESQSMPFTSKEMAARERERVKDFEERKAWRTARLKSITNEWANNRLEHSSLQKPQRASWKRSEEDIEPKRCDYLFCCFG
jgi:hypothetical protein